MCSAYLFFCKKKVNSIETKLYGIMLVCSCIDVLLVMLEVSFGYMNLSSITNLHVTEEWNMPDFYYSNITFFY